jgi:hypothetical protein
MRSLGFTMATEPVISFTFCAVYPVTTTSSRLITDSDSEIFKEVRCQYLKDGAYIQHKEITSVLPGLALMVNDPSEIVVAVIEVLITLIVAPERGVPDRCGYNSGYFFLPKYGT